MKTDQEASFAEREATLADREQAIAARETEISTKETDIATREAAARRIQHDSNVSFAEGLVGAGRLAPAGKDLVVGLLDQLSGAAGDTVSFGEGNAELSADAALRKLLEGAQPLVSFGEAAAPREEASAGTASFAMPSGYQADPKSMEIHRKALELQAADSSLSYTDAVKRAGG